MPVLRLWPHLQRPLAFALALAGLAAMGWGAWVGYQAQRPWPRNPPERPYPVADGMAWQLTADGLLAQPLPALAGQRTQSGTDALQPGDRLLAIEYVPTHTPADVRQLMDNLAPGILLDYHVRRAPNAAQPAAQPAGRQVLVRLLPLPPATLAAWPVWWWALLVAWAGLLLVCLVVVAVALPLVRSNWRYASPVVAELLLMAGVLGTGLVRMALGGLGPPLAWYPQAEALLLALQGAGLAVLGGWWLRGPATAPMLNRWLLPVLLVLAMGGILAATLALGWANAPAMRWQTAGVQLWVLAGALANYQQGLWTWRRMAWPRWGGLVPVLLLALAVGLLVAAGWPTALASWQGPLGWLAWLALLLPVAEAARRVVRFGNVGAVLQRTLGLGLLMAGLVGMAMLLRQATTYLGIASPGAELLEGLALVALLLVGRRLYLLNRPRLRRYFETAQQRRAEALNRLLATMPRYTHADALVDDVRQGLTDFLRGAPVAIWRPNEPKDQDQPALKPLSPHTLANVAQRLAEAGHPWGQTKELLPLVLPPDVEAGLQQARVGFALPLPVGADAPGLVLVAGRRRGVYTIEDIRTVERAVQQLGLTLEILNLLEREKRLEKQTLEANLTALRAQINPHFLFNTLNTISSLIHDAPDQAEEATIHLGDIFRHTLKFSSRSFVSVEEEMRLVDSYLRIEKIRFGERLHVHRHVDPQLLDWPVPAFMLSTLVENTIKHGISKILSQGEVRVELRARTDGIDALVADNGPGIDLNRIYQGHGLTNTLIRLKEIYGRDDLITFKNTRPGTEVHLFLPRQTLEG